ncbi:MAG: ATP-binding protein [Bacteroidales bacterium]
MNNIYNNIKQFCRFGFSHLTWVFFGITLVLLALSFVVTPKSSTLHNDVNKLEKRIQQRQEILEEYASKAIAYPVDEWIEFNDFPEDMVIYKYNEDTIQSWVNQFPISNDEVDILPLWYRLHYLNSRSLFNTPLAYLGAQEQYVNLGSAWYVVKVYRKDRVKLVTGLLIKTEYLSNNSVLVSKINPKLGIKRKLMLAPVTFDEGFVVKGNDGSILFSVIDDVSLVYKRSDNSLRWLAVIFACLTLYSFFYSRRTFKAFFIFAIGLSILRLISFSLSDLLRLDTHLFSPNLYADEGLFSSLGNFLLNNLFVFLIVLALYLLRRRIIIKFNNTKKRTKWVIRICVYIMPLALFTYINYTLNSLINNSSIALELYRLEELSIYSVLAYFSYGLLFIALLLLFQLMIPTLNIFRHNSILNIKALLVYVFIISLYTLITVSYLGYKKELERSKVWTNKLSVERDIGLELHLRSIENKIILDPINRSIMELPMVAMSFLQSRLDEIYFKGVSQKYEIKIAVCRPNDQLPLVYNGGRQYVDCQLYYDNIRNMGTPLADKSNFYFLNNYDGRVNYLGIITYFTQSGPVNLYIEFNSRFTKDVMGYPALLFDYKPADNVNMPASYSYAKYIDGRLVIYRGRYNYPMLISSDKIKEGFSTEVKDGYMHFINCASDDNIIIISRATRAVFPYIVSFSYLMLFYSALIFIFMRLRRVKKRAIRIKLPKNSFRRKITYLLTTSLVVALICMGLGSVWFSINYYNESNRLQMEEKLQTVQSTLADFCKYADQYNDINTPTLFQTMDKMANNTQADINLYDPHGRLIRSTQPELFERYLLASRMNPNAYRQLVKLNKRQVINKEKLAELSYYSLYAPIFNNTGKLIAIANIPYFSRNSDLRGDISSILAAIINVYILLLLAAILGGTVVSNQLSKPLAEISRKMQFMDVSKQVEHINYKNRDELGVLVGAYNKMVDDLEESTKRLAQTEREHAWSEMARQIAHEIKNPLTPMRLSIQHLVRLKQRNIVGWENKFEDVAGSILEQIDILSNTASEFSSFAKFYYEENTIINLYQVLNEQKILFDTRDNIRIAYNYESEGCLIYARKGQIIRVIVNLLSNAVQAVEASGRGYIRISLLQKGNNYVVSIEDNGDGVKEDDLNKLFKPNFTTKSSGTGLGLAISRNIIEQSSGRIFYSKSEFGGANFSFELPIHTELA